MMQCSNLEGFYSANDQILSAAEAAAEAAQPKWTNDQPSQSSCSSSDSDLTTHGSSEDISPRSCESLSSSPVDDDRIFQTNSRISDGTCLDRLRFPHWRASFARVSHSDVKSSLSIHQTTFRPDEIQRIDQQFSRGNNTVVIDDTLTEEGELIILEYAKIHRKEYTRTIFIDASSEIAFYASCFQEMQRLDIPTGESLHTCPMTLVSWLKKHPHTLLMIHSLQSEVIAFQINAILKILPVRTLIIDKASLIRGEKLKLRQLTLAEIGGIVSDKDLLKRKELLEHFGFYPPALQLLSGYSLPLSPEVNCFESLFDEIYEQLSPEAERTLRYLGCFHPHMLPIQGRPGLEELSKHRLISNNRMMWDVHQIISMRCSKSDCEQAYQTMSKWGVNHYLYHLDFFLRVAERVGFSCEIPQKRESALHLKFFNWEAAGDIYQKQYRFSEALIDYESACLLQNRPSAHLLGKLGEMQFNLGQIQTAMQTLNHALMQTHDRMTIGYIKGTLAQLHLQLHDFSKADQLALEAITALTDSRDLWVAPTLTRCAILIAEKKISYVRILLECLEKTLFNLQTDPCWVGLQLVKGYLNMLTKPGMDFEKIKIPPNLLNHPIRYEAAYLEGLRYFSKKDYTKAVKQFKKVIDGLKMQLGTENHPRIVDCHLVLQQIFKEKDCQFLLLHHYQKAKTISENVYPADHPINTRLRL